VSASRQRFPVLLPVLSLCLLWVPASAQSASRNVESWVSGELAEYVFGQLTTAPRFATAAVHVVVFDDGQPASRTNELSLSLRDSLRRSLAGRQGIRLGWQSDPSAPLQQMPTTAEECEAMRPELLIGIELKADASAAASVSVRALDEVEQRWVPGFGREWHGALTATQQRALASTAVDRAYLGRRDAPYGPSETDLIASHLARDLRCQLMRQVSGEYRLSLADAPTEGDVLAVVPSLVRHQVSGVSSLRLFPSAEEANVELSGQLHPVAGGLHQYWLTLEPIGAADGLQPVASSVYVEIPVAAPAGSLVRLEPVVPGPSAKVLGDLRLVRLANDPACGHAVSSTYGRYRGGDRCAAVQVTAGRDAIVFILNHQRNLGLVRLGDERCEPRPRVHVLRRGQARAIPLPGLDLVEDAQWTAIRTWATAPAGDVYYALASKDSDVARAIAAHVALLPVRCSASVRPGLDGAALAHWLSGLSAVLEQHAADVDWRAVQTRNVL
jgi:hypothetical protein